MGKPVLMVPGLGGLDSDTFAPTVQAMSIFGYIARQVARFGNRTILPNYDPAVTGLAREVIGDAYADAGRPELLGPDDVRYLTSQQFAYASGVAGILLRERPAASFLFGYFAAEALIFAEVGQQVGAVQVAGTTETGEIPFFIAACDYVIIGDEFYAASAYLSRDPTLLGSIVAQDWCKAILLALVLTGFALATAAAACAHAHLPVPHALTTLLGLLKT